MLALALQATLPVFITILVAVWLANRWGREFLWITLGFVALMLTLWWGLARPDGPFVERYIVPLLIYTPPLLVGGIVLHYIGRRRWQRAEIVLPLATVLALSNLMLARFFFTAGCVAKFWGCPELAPLLYPWE